MWQRNSSAWGTTKTRDQNVDRLASLSQTLFLFYSHSLFSPLHPLSLFKVHQFCFSTGSPHSGKHGHRQFENLISYGIPTDGWLIFLAPSFKISVMNHDWLLIATHLSPSERWPESRLCEYLMSWYFSGAAGKEKKNISPNKKEEGRTREGR